MLRFWWVRHGTSLLGGKPAVRGRVVGWGPGQNREPACLVQLEDEISAQGDSAGKTIDVTGRFLVLELRYVGQVWSDQGTVHVEPCDELPEDKPSATRRKGAWVESHASYRRL